MSGITQQLPALLGAVVGAAATYLAGAFTERARWRREQSSRWDDKRAQAYSEYGYAVKNVYVQCLRIAGSRLRSGPGDPVRHEEALAQLDVLTDDRTARWETVLLLGSPEAITAARAWHRRVWHVELFARGVRTDPGEYGSVIQQVIADRSRFYEAARRDLGITSGSVPAGGPWETSLQTSPDHEPPEPEPDGTT
jgi:hypothetical protein